MQLDTFQVTDSTTGEILSTHPDWQSAVETVRYQERANLRACQIGTTTPDFAPFSRNPEYKRGFAR